MCPWYGGVSPIAMINNDRDFRGKLNREAFTAQITNDTAANGIMWHGVRLSSDLTRDEHRGLRITLDLPHGRPQQSTQVGVSGSQYDHCRAKTWDRLALLLATRWRVETQRNEQRTHRAQEHTVAKQVACRSLGGSHKPRDWPYGILDQSLSRSQTMGLGRCWRTPRLVLPPRRRAARSLHPHMLSSNVATISTRHDDTSGSDITVPRHTSSITDSKKATHIASITLGSTRIGLCQAFHRTVWIVWSLSCKYWRTYRMIPACPTSVRTILAVHFCLFSPLFVNHTLPGWRESRYKRCFTHPYSATGPPVARCRARHTSLDASIDDSPREQRPSAAA